MAKNKRSQGQGMFTTQEQTADKSQSSPSSSSRIPSGMTDTEMGGEMGAKSEIAKAPKKSSKAPNSGPASDIDG